jgi:hypothetical protein
MNDVKLVGPNEKNIEATCKIIADQFQIKNLGQIEQYLDIRVIHDWK